MIRQKRGLGFRAPVSFLEIGGKVRPLCDVVLEERPRIIYSKNGEARHQRFGFTRRSVVSGSREVKLSQRSSCGPSMRYAAEWRPGEVLFVQIQPFRSGMNFINPLIVLDDCFTVVIRQNRWDKRAVLPKVSKKVVFFRQLFAIAD